MQHTGLSVAISKSYFLNTSESGKNHAYLWPLSNLESLLFCRHEIGLKLCQTLANEYWFQDWGFEKTCIGFKTGGLKKNVLVSRLGN